MPRLIHQLKVVLMLELTLLFPLLPGILGCGQFSAGAPQPGPLVCSDTCQWSKDGMCTDGGPSSAGNWCEYGTDCSDCGLRPALDQTDNSDSSPDDVAEFDGPSLCTNACIWSADGYCDDGGPNSAADWCDYGTDCADCGSRPDPSGTGDTPPDDILPPGDTVPPPGGSADGESIGTLKVNTQPGDPLIAEVNGDDDGGRWIYFGDKDSNGLPTRLDHVQHFAAGQDTCTTVVFDEQVRPVYVSGPNGEVLTLQYDQDDIWLNFTDHSGESTAELVQLEPGTMNQLLADIEAANPEWEFSARQSSADPLPQSLVSYKGRAQVWLTVGGAYAGDISDAVVTVTSSNNDLPISGRPIGTGYYDFTVQHQVLNLQTLIKECEDHYNSYSKWLTRAGIGFGVLTLLCAAGAIVTVALCTFLLASAGAGLSAGLGGGGEIAAQKSLTCKDYVTKLAIDSNQGQQWVRVDAKHTPSAKVGSKTIQYDVFNPADAYYATRSFDVIVEIEVPGAIRSMVVPQKLNPSTAYNIKFECRAPAGATLHYQVVGSDNFIDSETIVLPESGAATGKSIPGSKNGFQHTIKATLNVNGQGVDSKSRVLLFQDPQDGGDQQDDDGVCNRLNSADTWAMYFDPECKGEADNYTLWILHEDGKVQYYEGPIDPLVVWNIIDNHITFTRGNPQGTEPWDEMTADLNDVCTQMTGGTTTPYNLPEVEWEILGGCWWAHRGAP